MQDVAPVGRLAPPRPARRCGIWEAGCLLPAGGPGPGGQGGGAHRPASRQEEEREAGAAGGLHRGAARGRRGAAPGRRERLQHHVLHPQAQRAALARPRRLHQPRCGDGAWRGGAGRVTPPPTPGLGSQSLLSPCAHTPPSADCKPNCKVRAGAREEWAAGNEEGRAFLVGESPQTVHCLPKAGSCWRRGRGRGGALARVSLVFLPPLRCAGGWASLREVGADGSQTGTGAWSLGRKEALTGSARTAVPTGARDRVAGTWGPWLPGVRPESPGGGGAGPQGGGAPCTGEEVGGEAGLVAVLRWSPGEWGVEGRQPLGCSLPSLDLCRSPEAWWVPGAGVSWV